jgi:hypothetical protein
VRRDLLLQPPQGRDLPRIMQWIGWYSAMALNRLTGRCGHFWEARYFSTPIEPGDRRRVLTTLRTSGMSRLRIHSAIRPLVGVSLRVSSSSPMSTIHTGQPGAVSSSRASAWARVIQGPASGITTGTSAVAA